MPRVHPRGFNWKAGSFFVGYHLLLLSTLPFALYYHPPGLVLALGVLALLCVCGLTLTVLFHRCYSHRAFDLALPAELVLLYFGTLISQGSVLDWAFDHRRHHKYVEDEGDPHAITRGFWYAHILWILERRPPLDERVVHDLAARPLLRFHHKYYNLIWILVCASSIAALGWLSGDWFGAVYYGFLVRIFLSHHATFTINSFCHWRGAKTFDPDATAVDNWLWSLPTFGEGQHNYHHVFPFDYRIGSRQRHWDPGKWFIFALSAVGLASNLKRAPQRRIEERRARALEAEPPAPESQRRAA